MEKKYKLTEESINYYGKTLYRIEALKDFSKIKKGDKGGYVESEKNLSQLGNCWIHHDAKVYGVAKVYGNAIVCDDAEVYGDADIFDDAEVYGNARVSGEANVFGYAHVFGNAKVYGYANIYDIATVNDDAEVYDHAKIYNNAHVFHNARVFGNSQVCGEAHVYGEAHVFGDALIKSMSDYIVFKNWWSRGRYFTWTKSNNMWKVGCFYGTGKELIAKAYEDSELSGREYKRVVDYVESILQDNK